MHRQMCVTHTERDCRHGQKGACRACPWRKGGALYKTPEEEHECLVQSWYHAILFGSPIFTVPYESCGRPLQPEVRRRAEEGYRELAARLTDAQKVTIERMRRRAPNDIAEAADCSTDDAMLWLLALRPPPSAPFYAANLVLEAGPEPIGGVGL